MRDYSNYHNTNYTAKLLHDGGKVFEKSLITSPDSYDVLVNNEEKKIMVQSTSNYNERRILFKHGDIQWGDIVIHEDEQWLVTERPFFNKIYGKSHMELCTTSMIFTYFTDGVYEYDRLGNKIWIEEPTEVVKEFPCVVESISNLNTKITTGQPINVPEGDMVVTIPYTTDELIKPTSEFTMFGDKYRILGIDKSKVHRDKGVLILVVSRMANNT